MQKRDNKGRFIRTTEREFICKYCNKEQLKRRYNQKYCNSSCQMKYEYANGLRDKFKTTRKAREANIKKGLKKFKTNPTIYISKRGYKVIHIPIKGNKYYHQYIWEKNYGGVPEGFVLHHINLNKLDNRIENLQILPKREHHKLHDKLRKRNKKGQYNATNNK